MSTFPLLNLYPNEVCFNRTDNGIKDIINNSGEKESPWKIPLLMSTSPSELFFRNNSVFHMLMAVVINLKTVGWTLNSDKHS